jgi:hypothetical protein
MQTRKNKFGPWQLYLGVALSITGIIGIGALEWESIHLSARLGICLAGITLCLFGGKLILGTGDNDEPPAEFSGTYLGKLQLNGYDLVAYEQEKPDGRRQFRLASAIPLKSQQEASFIRYLVLEGFVASLWPQLSGRIEEEAGWAFMV